MLATVVDDQLTFDVFEDRRVAGWVGDREMHGPLGAVGCHDRDHAEGLLLQLGDRLLDGREVVQHVLRPGRDDDRRAGVGRGGILGFREVEQVGDEPLLVHAVGSPAFVDGRHDAAVFTGPLEGRLAQAAVAGHAAGEYPQVAPQVLLPVHRSPGDGLAPLAEVHGAGAGVGGGEYGREQGG